MKISDVRAQISGVGCNDSPPADSWSWSVAQKRGNETHMDLDVWGCWSTKSANWGESDGELLDTTQFPALNAVLKDCPAPATPTVKT